MNPQLAGHITSLLDKVGPETESTHSPAPWPFLVCVCLSRCYLGIATSHRVAGVFSYAFFNKLDGVTNALDNVDARTCGDECPGLGLCGVRP